MKSIKERFNNAGFTEHAGESFSDDKKIAWIFANKPGTPYQAGAECSSSSGTWGIGVSGINDDETRSEFIKMLEE
jgi:hypothetical protein